MNRADEHADKLAIEPQIIGEAALAAQQPIIAGDFCSPDTAPFAHWSYGVDQLHATLRVTLPHRGRRSSRLPDDQFHRVDGVTGGAFIWLHSNHLDKNVRSFEADFVLFDAHGGERGREAVDKRHVIVAGNRDIIGAIEPMLAKSCERADCETIVGAYNRRKARCLRAQ